MLSAAPVEVGTWLSQYLEGGLPGVQERREVPPQLENDSWWPWLEQAMGILREFARCAPLPEAHRVPLPTSERRNFWQQVHVERRMKVCRLVCRKWAAHATHSKAMLQLLHLVLSILAHDVVFPLLLLASFLSKWWKSRTHGLFVSLSMLSIFHRAVFF